MYACAYLILHYILRGKIKKRLRRQDIHDVTYIEIDTQSNAAKLASYISS